MSGDDRGAKRPEPAKRDGEVRVGASLSTDDVRIGIEDILVARVFRRTLIAQGFVFALIAAILVYAGLSIKGANERIREEQLVLVQRQDSLNDFIRVTRERIAEREGEITSQVEGASALVQSANQLITNTSRYQDQLAQNLVAIGENQAQTANLRTAVDNSQTALRVALSNVEETLSDLAEMKTRETAEMARVRRELEDSATVLRGDLRKLATMISHTFTETISEDTPMPVGTSGFVFQFDDLLEAQNTLNGVRLTHTSTRDPLWSDREFQLTSSEDVEVGGERYRITVLPGASRRIGLRRIPILESVVARVVIQIERLPGGGGAAPQGVAAIGPDR